jgi:hypothetical protein
MDNLGCSSERTLALHESAHAVVALAHKIGVRDVTIVPTRLDLGQMRPMPKSARILNRLGEGPPSSSDREHVEGIIILSLASVFAEMRVYGAEVCSASTLHDENNALDLALCLGDESADEETIYCDLQCRASIAVEKWWPQIEAVADALLEQRTLTGKDISDLIAGVGRPGEPFCLACLRPIEREPRRSQCAECGALMHEACDGQHRCFGRLMKAAS